MVSNQQIQRELEDIPPHLFPVWGRTLGYDRGMPQFLQRPEYAEEGVLTPTAGELKYKQRRRLVAPPMVPSNQLSLSPTEQVELEDNSPPVASPPSQDAHINDPALWQQRTWAPVQPSATGPMTSLPEKHLAFHEVRHYNPMPCGNLAEQSDAELDEEQQYHFAPSGTTPDSTSASMQLDSPSSVSPYGQVQSPLGHGEPMALYPTTSGSASAPTQLYLGSVSPYGQIQSPLGHSGPVTPYHIAPSDTILGSPSASMQLDPPRSVSPHNNVQSSLGHSEPMTPYQPEVRMADLSGSSPYTTPPYNTGIWR